MKPFVPILILTVVLGWRADAATSIDPVNKFSYGANLRWMDWRGDGTSGAVIGAQICSGSIYAANVGWIHLGGNAPANGVQYQNNSATDYGVNRDALGNLRGYAYGANIGWVNFENTGAPKVDLATGRLSGSIYSANCGWISLSNAFAYVQTAILNAPPVARADSITRVNNTRVAKVLRTTLLANDTDADMDPLSITAVGGALPSGATVALAGSFVVYTAPTISSGDGSYTYTLSDGPGGHTVTGTVTVTQVAPAGASATGPPNSAGSTSSGGSTTVTFIGVPGHTYRVQFATGAGPLYIWTEFSPLAIHTAPANGVFIHTDFNPPPPARQYRAIPHP